MFAHVDCRTQYVGQVAKCTLFISQSLIEFVSKFVYDGITVTFRFRIYELNMGSDSG